MRVAWQVAWRSVAWAVFALAALQTTFDHDAHHRIFTLAVAAALLALLFVTRTRDALPLQRFPRAFTMLATASSAIGVAAVVVCAPCLRASEHPVFLGTLTLLGLLTSLVGIGVVRMRGWSIALAGLATLGWIGAAFALHGPGRFDGMPTLPGMHVSLPYVVRFVMPAPLALSCIAIVALVLVARRTRRV